jgi:hypothetical protein
MRKLPKILKQIIKKKRFSLDTLDSTSSWRGGMKIDYRVTMVKSGSEDCWDHVTPLNTGYGNIYVNLKVRGSVEMSEGYGCDKWLMEISRATETRKNYWGGYECKYNRGRFWGIQPNKQIRREIRKQVKDEVKDFLKLMGISTNSWDGGIEIKTISWEK